MEGWKGARRAWARAYGAAAATTQSRPRLLGRPNSRAPVQAARRAVRELPHRVDRRQPRGGARLVRVKEVPQLPAQAAAGRAAARARLVAEGGEAGADLFFVVLLLPSCVCACVRERILLVACVYVCVCWYVCSERGEGPAGLPGASRLPLRAASSPGGRRRRQHALTLSHSAPSKVTRDRSTSSQRSAAARSSGVAGTKSSLSLLVVSLPLSLLLLVVVVFESVQCRFSNSQTRARACCCGQRLPLPSPLCLPNRPRLPPITSAPAAACNPPGRPAAWRAARGAPTRRSAPTATARAPRWRRQLYCRRYRQRYQLRTRR